MEILSVAVLLLCGLLSAQTPSGKFIGKVKDDKGVPLPGVSVEATSPRLVGRATTITDAVGTFRLFSLPSGTYTLRLVLDGFQTYVRKDIVLELEQTLVLNVTMLPSVIEEQVVVFGMSPLIDVKSTVKGMAIPERMFMALPKGRDFTELISIIPGVHYEGNTGGLSVDGATGTENMWYVDGTETTDMRIGTQGQGVVFELIDEVQVNASGYTAEYGGSMGGVINVITRSGGNSFHGQISGYYNDHSRLMYGKARDYLRLDPFVDDVVEYVNDDDILFDGGKSRDGYQRYEVIFGLGGYILKDRLWFFGAFNPTYSKTTAPRFFLPDDETQKTNFYRHRYNWNWQLKLTAQILGGLRISASVVNNFSKYRGSIPSIYGTSNRDFEWGREGLDYPNWSSSLAVDYTLGNKLLISARGGFFYSDTTNQQLVLPETRYYFGYANDIYPEIPDDLIRYRGWTNWSSSVYEYVNDIRDRATGKLDLTYYTHWAGEHELKTGIQFIRIHEDKNRTYPHPYVYLAYGRKYTNYYTGDTYQGKYGIYYIRGGWTSPYGDLWNIHRDTWTIYLQDSWTIGDKLTLQLGIRTESEYIPSFADPVSAPELATARPIKFDFKDKLAPRFGVIYDVFGDSSLKLFGNFALYYDVMKLQMAEMFFGGFKGSYDYYELNDWDWTKIAASGDCDDRESQSAYGANKLIESMNRSLTHQDAVDPNMKPMAQREITFGFEKRLMEGFSLSLRVVQKHLIRAVEDVGYLSPEGEMYYIANPGEGYSLPVSQGGKFDDSLWPTPKAKREYWGVNISFDKRFSNNWQGGISYTWSRVTGNYSGLSSSDDGGRNSPNVERYFDLWFMAYDLQGNLLDGPLPHDRTHYIKAYGSYSFPSGLTIGFVGFGRSGLPLTTTVFINGEGLYPYNRADLGRLPFTFWGNLYLEYNLRLAGRYNLQVNLNIDNFTDTDQWQAKDTSPAQMSMFVSDEEILSKDFDWQSEIDSYYPNPAYMKYTSKFDRWWARIGFRFSF